MTRSLLHLAAWAAGVAVLVAMLIAAAFVAVNQQARHVCAKGE